MTSEGTPLLSMGQVVGRNVQEIRNSAGLTQSEFTARCRRLGLSWHRPKVSALESGSGATNVSLANLVALAIALEVSPTELLKGEEDVRLTPYYSCALRELVAYLQGEGAPMLKPTPAAGARAEVLVDEDPPLEVEMARRFGVEVREIRNSAINAFDGRTLTEKRDGEMAKLGPLTKEERTTHRGHVMRRLADAIEADLKRRGKVY